MLETEMFENQRVNIDKNLWRKILEDPQITNDNVMAILQFLFSRPRFEGSGKEVAQALGYDHHAPLNNIVPKFAKRIMERYPQVIPPERKDGTVRYWHVPFLGSAESDSFNWILRSELVEALEDLLGAVKDEVILGEEFDNADLLHSEGSITTVLVNKYERSRKARKLCLDVHGYVCSVCGFDFERQYGPVGKGKIQVHHKKQISTFKSEYLLDAINDLVPVCANCHMIIHSKKVPFTIEEVREIIKSQRAATPSYNQAITGP